MFSIMMMALFSLSSFAQSSYTVPVPQELEAYSVFENVESTYTQTGNKLTINYPLPSELVGTNRNIFTLTGRVKNSRPFRMNGDEVSAKCRIINSELDCTVEYDNLVIDEASVRDVIINKYPDPVEQASRLEVARIFSGEPIGIIKIKVYKSSSALQ